MTAPAPPALLALGWDDDLAAALEEHPPDALPGRVTRGDRGGFYAVDAGTATVRARLPPRLRRGGDPLALPTVGDWVVLGAERIDGHPAIAAVLPRRTAFVRQAPEDRPADAQVLAANVDTTLVVFSIEVEPNQARLDRFLALAHASGAPPVVLLTKADRCEDVEAVTARVEGATLGVPIHALSAVTGEGLEALDGYLRPGRTAVLLGPSGAGKSTLANRLLGEELLATRAVRDDGRGRHTTTHRQLLRLPGGALLIDTPGLRELGLYEAEEGLAEVFGDVAELSAACRFGDCRHESEPGCEVTAAVRDGRLDPERVARYRTLERELAHQARKTDARLRQAEQRRWKRIHRDLRAHPKPRG